MLVHSVAAEELAINLREPFALISQDNIGHPSENWQDTNCHRSGYTLQLFAARIAVCDGATRSKF